MAARSIHASLHYPPIGPRKLDIEARHLSELRTSDLYEDDNLGAFRGLAFAVAFQITLGLFAFIGWELWHMLR